MGELLTASGADVSGPGRADSGAGRGVKWAPPLLIFLPKPHDEKRHFKEGF